MTLFVYDGRNSEGNYVRGQINADSLNSAIESLRAQQFEIYDLRPADWREALQRHRVFMIGVAVLVVALSWLIRWTQRQQAVNLVQMALAWTTLDDGTVIGIDPTTHETVYTRHLKSVVPVDIRVTRDQHSLLILDKQSPEALAIDLTRMADPPRRISLLTPAVRLITLPNGYIGCLHVQRPGFTVLDQNTLKVVAYRGFEAEPGDVAATPDGRYWVVSEPALDRLVVFDNQSGRVAARLTVATQPDRLTFSPNGHDLWILCRDGNLRRIELDFSGNSPRITARSDGVSSLGGKNPIAILAPVEDRCYVLNKDDGVVGVISAADLSLIRMVPTGGSGPCAWALSSTQQMWVANGEGQSLGIMDMGLDQSIGHVTLHGTPTAIEISSPGMSP
ncbi:MAG: YncE family protein [Candidatus Xenobia bacterium]